MRTNPLVLAMLLCAAPAFAAGNGAGAGGAGHQRAINSGLTKGEAGPPGSPNNPRAAAAPRDGIKGSPRSEGDASRR